MFSSNTTQVSDGGYQISRSLRFNSADSTSLNRTPASATNRQTWTWSAWVKRSTLGVAQFIFGQALSDTSAGDIRFASDDTFGIVDESISLVVTTTQVFRDVSAWYHIVVAVDTTQATSSNRVKLYVNGTQITTLGTATYPAQNANTQFNTTNTARLGARSGVTPYNFYNGYITELNWIDGTQLTPSSFGETNAQTGVWQPKAYSGSYGTNGFYLNFSDNSNTTAATLGKDYSGNGNNWTPNNFSVTAGVGNDSLIDTPTPYGVDTGVGGSVRGNYCTMNPLSAGSYVTLSNGNLQIVGNTASDSGVALSTIAVTTGIWYWETTCVATGGLSYAGFGKLNSGYSSLNDAETFLALYGGGYRNGGQIYGADRQITTTSTFGDGDIIGIALDMTNGAAYLSKNGTFLNSGVPTSGSSKTGAVWAWTPSSMPYAICPAGGGYNNSSNYLNLGQRAFAYTAPSGFKALCTQNLPTPTIGATTATQAGKYFNTLLWTSNAAVQSITGAGFQPDLVWVKSRTSNSANEGWHHLVDAVRGTAAGVIATNSSNSTFWGGTNYSVTAFNSDGFSSGIYDGLNGNPMVTWLWKANGSGSTNTSGSITSTVSVNTTSGFSIVTYTGVGGVSTVGHGLGVAPSMMIFKDRDVNANWPVYHKSLGNTVACLLNDTAASTATANWWNNTNPTSSVVTIGSNENTNLSKYVAYCFTEIAGYSSFGKYTGNGSADGPFVYTGMRPAFILVKASSGTSAGSANWLILDSTRDSYNVAYNKLASNLANAENTGTIGDSTQNNYDLLSNGFKARTTNGSSNENGTTYIYMAFASNPFKYSLAR